MEGRRARFWRVVRIVVVSWEEGMGGVVVVESVEEGVEEGVGARSCECGCGCG